MDALNHAAKQIEYFASKHSRLKEKFKLFRDDAADFFNGTGGPNRIASVAVTLNKDDSINSFAISFIDRSFAAKLSTRIEEDGTMVGLVELHEDDFRQVGTRVRVAQITCKANGEVNLPSHSENDAVLLGEHRSDTIYIILKLIEAAVSKDHFA